MTQVALTPDSTTLNPTMMSQHLLEKAQNLSGVLGIPSSYEEARE
jgi:hypothetical protein